MTNQKIINTQDSIKKALIAAIQQKGLTHFSVTDITKLARINRSTFYLHYVDKFALIDFYENKVVDDVQKLIDQNITESMTYQDITAENFKTYPAIKLVINYVYTEFSLISALLGPNGDPYLEIRLKKLIAQVILDDLKRVKGNQELTKYLPHKYAMEIMVSEFFAIIELWLKQEHPEEPNEIIDIIMKSRYLSPFDILGLKRPENS
jgi:AcrR family transcriptional regulator